MTNLQKLLQCSDSEKKAILGHYNITEADLEDYVNVIFEWLKKTNLPKNDDTFNKIRTLLFNCKMSIEECKKVLAAYYRIRTLYSDFFDSMMPNSEKYEKAKRLVNTVVMPKLTPDFCRITILRLHDPHLEMDDGLFYQLLTFMLIEMRIKSGDMFLSNIFFIDLQNFELKHLMKYGPPTMKKLSNIILGMKLRLKNIHYVNAVDNIDRLMVFVKTMLPKKFEKKVQIHRNMESLYDYIPKEYLPSDYNGDQPSIKELYDEWCEELESRVEDFEKLLDAKSVDDEEEAIIEREIFGVGCDGSFKKISID